MLERVVMILDRALLIFCVFKSDVGGIGVC